MYVCVDPFFCVCTYTYVLCMYEYVYIRGVDQEVDWISSSKKDLLLSSPSDRRRANKKNRDREARGTGGPDALPEEEGMDLLNRCVT